MGNYQHSGDGANSMNWPYQCFSRSSRLRSRHSSGSTNSAAFLRSRHTSGSTSSAVSESDADDTRDNICSSNIAREFSTYVGNSDVIEVEHLLERGVDINMPINEKDETALALAVKMGHDEVVRLLLNVNDCDKNSYNVNGCSVLDIALINVFDNVTDTSCTVRWEILATLMVAGAEPNSRDAMTYVIHNALKNNNLKFIHSLISSAAASCLSTTFHTLLLEKLHRHQSICDSDLDPVFDHMTLFTINLLRNCIVPMLQIVVDSLVLYLESYWHSKPCKCDVFRKLVMHASGAGWKWTAQQLKHIHAVDPQLANWCRNIMVHPASLAHNCRLVFRRSISQTVDKSIDLLPFNMPDTLRKYLLLYDIWVLSKSSVDVYL